MGKKQIFYLTFTAIVYLLSASNIMAIGGVAGNSAVVNKPEINIEMNEYFLKKKVIKSVLEEYNSPLVDSVDSFINTCREYNLDCYLLPSITGVESFFGKYLVADSFNPFGWGGGYIYFKDYSDAINTVGAGLRNYYINKGADDVDKIGPIYAQSQTWSPKVKFFMSKFEKAEQKYHLFFDNHKVEL